MVSVPFMCSCDGDEPDAAAPLLEIKTVSVGAESGSQFISVQASGAWTLTVQDQSGEALDWLTVQPSEGNGSKSNIVLSVSANTSGTSRTAVLTLKASNGLSSRTLVQKGTSSSGGSTGGGDNPGGDTGVAQAGWLELPAIPENSDWGFFTHDMTLGSVKTRNYSFAWDYDALVAPWVAYPLCKWNIGNNIKRTNDWGLDPKLPRNKQPVLYNGFKTGNVSGWFARGHQIPSADRLYDAASNGQTFYGTNMTPQLQEQFNGTIWANLEGKVRSWANRSDTLYVVTGCVTSGSTKYCLDNDGKKVTVPTAYYKAVLRYMKSSSTLGYSGYMGCAIWLDHKDYDDAAVDSSYSMSIDDLEKKLGIDLFVNLPARIGEEAAAKVEAENPRNINWWW